MSFTAVRWFSTSTTECRQTSAASTHTPTPETLNLCKFLLDYRKQKELAEGIGAEEEESGNAGKSNLSANLTWLSILFIVFLLLYLSEGDTSVLPLFNLNVCVLWCSLVYRNTSCGGRGS